MSFEDEVKKELNSNEDEFYFPGHLIIGNQILEKEHIKTLSDPATDRNDVYIFNGQIYERGEEIIKHNAEKFYMSAWSEMRIKCEDFLDSVNNGKSGINEDFVKAIKKLRGRIKNSLKNGPNTNDINEVLAYIRRNTYTERNNINPVSHVPYLNGFLNLKSRKLEAFTPELFYTWQVEANYLNKVVTLNDVPKFRYYLNSIFFEIDIPMILTYGGYALQPGFPRNKILLVVGRERVGKGVLARILRKFNPKGYGTISFEKLLISDNRFAFQSVLGKNLLVDAEMKRVFRRGFEPDYANINKLFGSDLIDVERKGKDIEDWTNRAKGMLFGNLPIYKVDNPALIARTNIIRTKDSRETPEIMNIDESIFNNEKDEIATLLMHCYFGLEDRNFVFPGEMANSGGIFDLTDPENPGSRVQKELLGTLEYWELLADPVTLFVQSETISDIESEVAVDVVYTAFSKWCGEQGIATMAQQTFTNRFAEFYMKKYRGSRDNRKYFFVGVQLIMNVKPDSQSKLNTGVKDQKPKYNGGSWNTKRRVQLMSYTEKSYEKNNEIIIVNEIGQKLNTGILGTENVDNTASPDTKNRVQPFPDNPDFGSLEIFLRDHNHEFTVEGDKLRIKTPTIEVRKDALVEIAKGHHFELVNEDPIGELCFKHKGGS